MWYNSGMYNDCKVYKLFHKKMKRHMAHLYYSNTERHTISWAKYIWETYYDSAVPQGLVVDHIDNNPLNDVITNLQLLTNAENTQKRNALHPQTMITFNCAYCGGNKSVRKGNSPMCKGLERGYCNKKCMGLYFKGKKKRLINAQSGFDSQQTHQA